jgi:hypothetical protein
LYVCTNNNAKKYLLKENLQFVLVRKTDEIRDKIKRYGEMIRKSIEEDGH